MTATPIHYKVELASPEHHYFKVTLRINRPNPSGQALRLPAWIPGSYMIRDFAKNIVTFEANSDTKTLGYTRSDKSTWLIEPCADPIEVTYLVYAFDASIRAAYLDFTYGFANGTSLCMEVLGQSNENVSLEVTTPASSRLGSWEVATTLPTVNVDHRGFGLFEAENYDALIDHPMLFGELTKIPFQVNDIPHRLVLVGKHYANQEALAKDLTTICSAQHKLWGESPDFSRYDFLTIVTENGFGGLEHRSSTALMCPRETLECGNKDTPKESYLDFLSLCSHEYFHNWNIKRLKPESFIPYQLDSESYTNELWWFEGVTSYFDDLMLYRSGVIDVNQYLKLLAKTLSRGLKGVGHTRQSLEESSLMAWTTFYQQNENAPNAISSYYAKGAVLACYLDLKLMEIGFSIDQLLQNLWEQHGRTAKGTTFDKILNAIAELGSRELADEIKLLVTQPTTPPIQELLEKHGVQVSQVASHPLTLLPTAEMDSATTYFGAALKETSAGLEVVRVLEDSPAAKAGVSAKDVVIAIDGLKATAKQWQLALQRFSPGQSTRIHYFRDHTLLNAEVEWEAPPQDTYVLSCALESALPWKKL
ncbi:MULTISPECIES: M61 family metallopeptidase [Gammaproteobacteria]|uniref:M61 family metallopeptidase n=1 Tax=Gammaproteobacteria TaxID=1236 RepID=UPI000DD03622|nr:MULTISPECIES: PDZ domain-containing protein [Gammaproteobacteria]RTE87198.1 M61 family peptidase [Aliidiomarina sp. B3213]TCZ93014.1 M61 family peptidase [Lysobacter sp. N42]